ncbi:MAG: FtsQ-type POTRA domain-containing protein [Oscillospiraceae bacterium]|nr:FtsQ-type POTRA domain-containing protein [Oscillospiraceae bacterium]
MARDVQKTSMETKHNARRERRRRRGRMTYVLLVLLLTVAVLVSLSMTVLFNIKTIRVTGNADSYTPEEIVEAAGVAVGDNMMRINLEEREQAALEQLIDVETVDLKRQFPSTLVIDVQKCTPAYNVMYEYGTLIVSEHGKILDNTMDPMQGLVNIYGYKPEETTPGKPISAEEERYDKVFTAFRDLIYEGSLGTPIVSVDMTDFNDILVNFDNRIEFDMGNWSEIRYKIDFAEQIISEQPADKEGYLTMVGSNQCSFRNKADVEASRQPAESAPAVPAETTDEASTQEETLP